MKAFFNDVEKEKDIAVSEHTRFSTKVDRLKATTDELEDDGLKSHITFEAQIKYINHFYYLLDPLMENLSEDVDSCIRDLSYTYSVKVEEKLLVMVRW